MRALLGYDRAQCGHSAVGAGWLIDREKQRTMIEPDGELIVRIVDANDAPQVRALMLAGFEQFKTVLDPPSSAFWETDDDVAAAIERDGAAIAGLGETAVGSVRFEPEGEWLYIGRLAVLPAARRCGVAQGLMFAAEAEAGQLGVTVSQLTMREVLPGNRALFEKLGYEVVSIEPHPRNPEQNTLRDAKSADVSPTPTPRPFGS
ncbi:MAG: GNAT family N-acetyltransferase [Xanthomonadales bacterium]|nr:GNAT family N-acetyltransferase [Xanthomonadales bacterium]